MDYLQTSLAIGAAGLEAQTHRMRIISENIANAGVTATTPGDEPYVRKTIAFGTRYDADTGVPLVQIRDIGVDRTPFRTLLQPGHPAADEQGMVKMPNVDLFVELADMRETIRSYEANMRANKQAREMISMAIDMMRG